VCRMRPVKRRGSFRLAGAAMAVLLLAVLLPSPARADEPAAYRKVGGFVSGQSYLVGVESDAAVYVLSCASEVLGAKVADAAAPIADALWSAGSGVSLRSGEGSRLTPVYMEEQSAVVLRLAADSGGGPGGAPGGAPGGERPDPPPGGGSPGGPPPDGGGPGDSGWTYEYDAGSGAGKLSYPVTVGETTKLYYLTFEKDESEASFGCTDNASQAAAVVLYTNGEPSAGDIRITKQPEAVPYVISGEAHDAPTFSVTVDAPAGAVTTWSVDGVSAADPGEALRDAAVGVHEVCCTVAYTDANGTAFAATSDKVNYIVCGGVIENSLLTFSDVHETFGNIGKAIGEIMAANDGKIPALIVCTGDWANVHPNVDHDTTVSTYLPALKAQSGGIDTVFVAGNHENGAAASEASAAADLGYDAARGVVYNSAVRGAAVSSRVNDGLIVFGVNFDDIHPDGGYRYANVIGKLTAFFESLMDSYNNELIVTSAHAGLHVLGVQPESNATAWAGDNAYNVDGAYDVVTLLNSYADAYGMDILFLFGHDHSKKETEFLLGRGDAIYSTKDYAASEDAERYGAQTLRFTYAHAGYLTGSINGTEHYSFITWNGDAVTRRFAQIGHGGTEQTVTRLPLPVAPSAPVSYDDGAAASDTVTVPASGGAPLSVSVSGGVASVRAPSQAELDRIIDGSAAAGVVTIDMTGLDRDIAAVSIPADTMKAIEKAVSSPTSGADALTLKLTDGSVRFDAAALAAIVGRSGSGAIRLDLESVRESSLTAAQRETARGMDVQAVYSARLTGGGARIGDFGGGSAAVTVPYTLKAGQTARGVAVWHVADDGGKTEVPAALNGAEVTFTVRHFSNYILAYDEARAAACPRDATCPIAAFADADSAAWYHDGVHWALENGVMDGTGGGRLAPDGATSRAMAATMLWRLEGAPVVSYDMAYSDVSAGQWYAEAVRWATRAGVITGYDGRFAPDGVVTREQLAAMLYRYARYKGADVGGAASLLGYSDASSVSAYAAPAVQWALENGILKGVGETELAPSGAATRAQLATIMMRFSALTSGTP